VGWLHYGYRSVANSRLLQRSIGGSAGQQESAKSELGENWILPCRRAQRHGIVEVTGSIPVGSTKDLKGLDDPLTSPFLMPEARRKPAAQFAPFSRTFVCPVASRT
jgi:hypothetical protein